MRIDEFLLARIAEDEAVARAGISSQEDEGWSAHENGRTWFVSPHVGVIYEAVQVAHVVRWTPWRALAECEAKRAIVAIHKFIDYGPASVGEVCERCVSPDDWVATPFTDEHYPCSTLRHLAAVYAGHPDYRDEWRP